MDEFRADMTVCFQALTREGRKIRVIVPKDKFKLVAEDNDYYYLSDDVGEEQKPIQWNPYYYERRVNREWAEKNGIDVDRLHPDMRPIDD